MSMCISHRHSVVQRELRVAQVRGGETVVQIAGAEVAAGCLQISSWLQHHEIMNGMNLYMNHLYALRAMRNAAQRPRKFGSETLPWYVEWKLVIVAVITCRDSSSRRRGAEPEQQGQQQQQAPRKSAEQEQEEVGERSRGSSTSSSRGRSRGRSRGSRSSSSSSSRGSSSAPGGGHHEGFAGAAEFDRIAHRQRARAHSRAHGALKHKAREVLGEASCAAEFVDHRELAVGCEVVAEQ